MQIGEKEVKVTRDKQQVPVGIARYNIFDSVDEAVNTVGEAKALQCINAQVRTDEMNKIRANARGGPGKRVLEQKAIAMITAEEWQTLAGNQDAIAAKIQSNYDRLKAEHDAANPGSSEDDED